MNRPPTHAPATDGPTPDANKPASGWRRARLLLPALLCLSGACAPGSQTPKTWRAEAQLMVISPPPSAPGDPLRVVPAGADDPVTTQIALLQNREMARRVAAELKNEAMTAGTTASTASLTADDIQKSIRVTNPPGTRLLVVTAEAADPKQAQDLANATAHAFVEYKRFLATLDMTSVQSSLEHQAARAALALDAAERQERLSKQAAALSPDGSARLHENTEIAREIYRRLQTSLAAARLQRDLVSGDVTITQYAEMPKTPSSP